MTSFYVRDQEGRDRKKHVRENTTKAAVLKIQMQKGEQRFSNITKKVLCTCNATGEGKGLNVGLGSPVVLSFLPTFSQLSPGR